VDWDIFRLGIQQWLQSRPTVTSHPLMPANSQTAQYFYIQLNRIHLGVEVLATVFFYAEAGFSTSHSIN
jgi:hypothetical protein